MRIDPIIEYAVVDCHDTERVNTRYTLWDYFVTHSYWSEVTQRLDSARGLYIFYDSMTCPLYVGIAKDRSIWVRANESYNASRGRNGKILTANHPVSNVAYDPTRTRKLKRTDFTLADVASHFSAYEVSEEHIDGLEAFSIRAFGGVLMNTKMEGNGGFGLGRLDVS